MRVGPVGRDAAMAALCYVCALALCVSPLIPYQFATLGQVGIGMAALGTPLAAIGIWLNHVAGKSPKKQ